MVESSGIKSIINIIQICTAILELNHGDRETDGQTAMVSHV
jgi:hypothetical protein